MAGYVVGTQEWYDATRRRLLEISKKLRSPDTDQEEKNRLFKEQVHLIDNLEEYSTDDLVNTPIV